MNAVRYQYAGPYSTREKAELSLENAYADGEISPSERPQIETRRNSRMSKPVYIITLLDR